MVWMVVNGSMPQCEIFTKNLQIWNKNADYYPFNAVSIYIHYRSKRDWYSLTLRVGFIVADNWKMILFLLAVILVGCIIQHSQYLHTSSLKWLTGLNCLFFEIFKWTFDLVLCMYKLPYIHGHILFCGVIIYIKSLSLLNLATQSLRRKHRPP